MSALRRVLATLPPSVSRKSADLSTFLMQTGKRRGKALKWEIKLWRKLNKTLEHSSALVCAISESVQLILSMLCLSACNQSFPRNNPCAEAWQTRDFKSPALFLVLNFSLKVCLNSTCWGKKALYDATEGRVPLRAFWWNIWPAVCSTFCFSPPSKHVKGTEKHHF